MRFSQAAYSCNNASGRLVLDRIKYKAVHAFLEECCGKSPAGVLLPYNTHGAARSILEQRRFAADDARLLSVSICNSPFLLSVKNQAVCSPC